MIFSIDLLKGAENIFFGMTPNEVRAELGGKYKSFKKTYHSKYPCDYFEELGVFVYYKLPGLVEAIEFSEPAKPILEEKNLLCLPFEQLKSILLSKDTELEIEPDSLTSYSLGVGVYAPDANRLPNSFPESIIVFERGYYD